jgi:aspartate/methionine/tyrosine aminotransferase
MAVTALVESLRRQGRDVIDLGAGEPDFPTPESIREAGIKAIRDGFTKYTPAAGLYELREAVCAKYHRDCNLEFQPQNVLITCGAKHAIANAILAVCEEGDEVIFSSPFWTSYLEQVKFSGASPVVIPTDEATGFKITPEQLLSVLSSRTKLLLLNSPANPTGSVYSEDELRSLAGVLQSHDCYVLYDEIYEKIIYDGCRHFNPATLPELEGRVLLVNGLSKAYSMTGWRIGFLTAPEDVIKQTIKIQSHTTSNPCSISQKAGIEALNLDDSVIADMVNSFDQRRRFTHEALTGIPGVACDLPAGAFYLFPSMSGYLGRRTKGKILTTPLELCSYLLDDAGIALVPGEAFDSLHNVRISYATSLGTLREAARRLSASLLKIHDWN